MWRIRNRETEHRVAARKQLVGLWIASAAALALVVAWFVLNHLRAQFYNSAMEGLSAETSPYWTIIRIQKELQYPILFFAVCSAVLLLCELVRLISLRIRH
jgi:hypothetical protein